jgi:hypothetical protein
LLPRAINLHNQDKALRPESVAKFLQAASGIRTIDV